MITIFSRYIWALVGLTCLFILIGGYSCTISEKIKDDAPVITEYVIPESTIEGTDTFVQVSTWDDHETIDVHMQFESQIIPLKKVESEVDDAEPSKGEEAIWEAYFTMPPGSYAYSIVADDSRNKATLEGEITIQAIDADKDNLTLDEEMALGTDPEKPNPNVKYALDKGISPLYIGLLMPLDEDGHQDDTERQIIDLICKLPTEGISEDVYIEAIEYIKSEDISSFEAVLSQSLEVSEEAACRILELGLDNDTIDYLSFVSTIEDSEHMKYILECGLCFQDHDITDLEKNFLKNPSGNYMNDLYRSYLYSICAIDAELAAELEKLPDLMDIEVKDVEAIEDILYLAEQESVFGTTFESILNTGIKEKRKYCSTLEALLWIMYDYDKESFERIKIHEQIWYKLISVFIPVHVGDKVYHLQFGEGTVKSYQKNTDVPLYEQQLEVEFADGVHKVSIGQVENMDSSGPWSDVFLRRLVGFSWAFSSISIDPQSAKWEDMDDVVDRLNSPFLIAQAYPILGIEYATHLSGKTQTPELTFRSREGDCDDQAWLWLHCLLKNGYNYDDFENNETDSVCGLSVWFDEYTEFLLSWVTIGHAVILLKIDGEFYIYEYGAFDGPYDTNDIIDIGVEITGEYGLRSCELHDIDWNVTRTLSR